MRNSILRYILDDLKYTIELCMSKSKRDITYIQEDSKPNLKGIFFTSLLYEKRSHEHMKTLCLQNKSVAKLKKNLIKFFYLDALVFFLVTCLPVFFVCDNTICFLLKRSHL